MKSGCAQKSRPNLRPTQARNAATTISLIPLKLILLKNAAKA